MSATIHIMPTSPAQPEPTNYSDAVAALRRREKAERFANTLDAWSFTSKQLAAMSPHEWELLAQAIGENVPSELTVPLICQMIQAREAAREKQRQEKGQHT